jgi:hypothetical protein
MYHAKVSTSFLMGLEHRDAHGTRKRTEGERGGTEEEAASAFGIGFWNRAGMDEAKGGEDNDVRAPLVSVIAVRLCAAAADGRLISRRRHQAGVVLSRPQERHRPQEQLWLVRWLGDGMSDETDAWD